MKREIRTHGVVILALLAFGPRFAFSADARLSVWFAPSAAKIPRDARPVPSALKWDMAAARNETEACQLVVSSNQPCRDVTVTVADFRQKNGSAHLTPALYRVGYVPDIVGHTPYPDPLPPLRPFDLAAGAAQPVWISVHVPRDAPPGRYATNVTVTAQGQRRTFPLTLQVWNFALPDTPSCTTAFGIDPDSIARQHHVAAGSPAASQLYERYYALLLDHHVSAYTIPADLMSEAAARFLDDPRLTSFVIPYPASDEGLKKLVDRLAGRGWLAKGVFYPIDEPVTKDAYTALEAIGSRLHKLVPSYRWVVPFYRGPDFDQKHSAFDLMAGRVNVWCPNLHYFDQDRRTRPFLAERHRRGEKVWWYVCCGPGEPYNNFFVSMSAMAHRVLFWQQKRERVDGLLYWNTTYWDPRSTKDPWQSMMTVKDINPNIRGDGSLLYPGTPVGIDGPVSSLRLEVIRDGLEDFDYLTLAEKRLGSEATSKLIARIAPKLTSYETDPLVLEKVRRELGQALETGGR
ncbi:MAG: glycoside hydrolase domain-containing protein [Isosphaeraceae bacterium]